MVPSLKKTEVSEDEPVEEAMPETEEETVVEVPDILGDLLDED